MTKNNMTELLSSSDAAKALGLSEQAIGAMIHSGELEAPAFREAIATAIAAQFDPEGDARQAEANGFRLVRIRGRAAA